MAAPPLVPNIAPPPPMSAPVEPESALPRARLKPAKTLPTDRLTTDNQLSILRAYVAASGAEKNAVSNADVERIASISANSVSLCNVFFNEMGWLARDGMKQRPTETAYEYFQAHQWNPDSAGTKLAPTVSQSWFGKTLLPKLAFRSLAKDEALGFIAEEAKATPDYRKSLETVIEYLLVCGLVKLDGNLLARNESSPSTAMPQKLEQARNSTQQENSDCDAFNIPIPNKAAVTITFPKNIDADDWTMVTTMMAAYMKRLKGFEVGP